MKSLINKLPFNLKSNLCFEIWKHILNTRKNNWLEENCTFFLYSTHLPALDIQKGRLILFWPDTFYMEIFVLLVVFLHTNVQLILIRHQLVIAIRYSISSWLYLFDNIKLYFSILPSSGIFSQICKILWTIICKNMIHNLQCTCSLQVNLNLSTIIFCICFLNMFLFLSHVSVLSESTAHVLFRVRFIEKFLKAKWRFLIEVFRLFAITM